MVDKNKQIFFWIMIFGGIFIVLASVSFAVLNLTGDIVRTPTATSAEQVQRISLEEAKSALDVGSALFIDVRDSSSYEQAHITGAMNIPINVLPNHLSDLNPGSWIITYCT